MSHPALVSEADFIAVQQCRAARRCEDEATRDYVLAGLVQYRVCGRRMDAHWVNGRAGYRCRHGHQSARTRPPDAARNIYVREDVLLVVARHALRVRSAPIRRRRGVEHRRRSRRLVAGPSTVIVCGGADWTLAPAERTLTSGPTTAPAKVRMG
jgi:hypothetical protein